MIWAEKPALHDAVPVSAWTILHFLLLFTLNDFSRIQTGLNKILTGIFLQKFRPLRGMFITLQNLV